MITIHIYIYINDKVNRDSIEEHIRISDVSSCYLYMTNNFNKNIIYNKYHNTSERKKVEKAIIRGLSGHISGSITNKENCARLVKESKTWIYKNK